MAFRNILKNAKTKKKYRLMPSQDGGGGGGSGVCKYAGKNKQSARNLNQKVKV
jgi:hypothetical protein